MSAPLVPSPLDSVGRRRFAFYPAIRNGDPNEWIVGHGSWAEVQVVNACTGCEVWIPRQYIGVVSDPPDRPPVVRLTQELENVAGVLRPRGTRVIQMPRVRTNRNMFHDEQRRAAGPASVVGIRLEEREDSPMNKAVARLGIMALVIAIIAELISVVSKL